MKKLVACILVIALLGICEWTQVQSVVAAPSIDIWTAAAQGNIEAIKQHVSAGTDLNAKEPKRGITPLMMAALYGQTEAASLLIENGANPNARDNEGETALHKAALLCHTEIVKLLLDKDAEVNAKGIQGLTPLDMVASPWGREWEGIYRNVGGNLQIQLDLERIKATRPQVAAILRRSGGKIGGGLWMAAAQGNIEAIKQHVSAGTDLNAKEPAVGGNTPLMMAALIGQTEATRLLIENGANLNARNNDGYTALHLAAFLCRTETVKLLLDKDAEVNAKSIKWETPLDTVTSPWSQELEGLYRYVEGLLEIQLDLERIKAARPQVAAILRRSGGELGPEPPDDAIRNFVSTIFYGAARGVAAGFKHADSYFYAEQKDTGLWRDAVSRLRDAVSRLTDGKSGFHLFLTLIGLVVIIAIGLAARWLFRRTTTNIQEKILNAVRFGKLQFLGQVLSRMLLDALGIGIYMLATFIIFAIFFREGTANYMIVSIYLIRSYYVIVLALGAKVIFSPQAASLRLFPIEDRDATFLYKWILRIIFITMFFAGAGEIFRYFGVHEQLYLLMHSSSGIFVILALVIMIWQSRLRVAQAIWTEGADAGSGGGSLRAAFARKWHYFASLYVLVAGGFWTSRALNQENVRVLNLILSIFLIPIVIGVDQWVQRLLKSASGEAHETIDQSGDKPAKIDEQAEAAGKMDWTHYVPLIRRFFRIFLLAFLIFVSLHLWGIDIQIGRMFTRSASIIVLILLLSFITWQFIKARIDKRLRVEMPDDDEEMEEGGRGGSRIGTLLVLLRKFILSVLFVVVSLIILSSLGLDIGPLIAGAGVIGLAIGFGSQTLVRDILSGVFFLIDDAFRVGDYIEAGGIKGMVQHISLRSVKLRHPRGMVFTIPFGDMGAVQNFSRDYIITKLDVRVRYDADVEKIRKIVKRIGKELEQHEEIGPVLLSPIKSQGVREMDDSAMILRVKFKTPPGEQFVVRREVYRLIQERFREHGIEFAHRNVTVYLPPEASQTTSGEEQDKGAKTAGAPDKKIIAAGAAAAIAAAQVDEDVKKPKGQ